MTYSSAQPATAAAPFEDPEMLRKALREANTPTLLMVYTQLTHDEEFLERFAPHIRSPFSGQPTEIPASLEEELRQRLIDELSRPKNASERPVPPALLSKMMSIGVGEPVADEFILLLLE